MDQIILSIPQKYKFEMGFGFLIDSDLFFYFFPKHLFRQYVIVKRNHKILLKLFDIEAHFQKLIDEHHHVKNIFFIALKRSSRNQNYPLLGYVPFIKNGKGNLFKKNHDHIEMVSNPCQISRVFFMLQNFVNQQQKKVGKALGCKLCKEFFAKISQIAIF